MPDLKIDWEAIINEAAEGGKAALGEFLDGAQEDIKSFAAEIARDMVEAVKLGRWDLVDQMKAQGRTLAEAHRIRLNEIAWSQAMGIFERLSKVAVKAVSAVTLV